MSDAFEAGAVAPTPKSNGVDPCDTISSTLGNWQQPSSAGGQSDPETAKADLATLLMNMDVGDRVSKSADMNLFALPRTAGANGLHAGTSHWQACAGHVC